MAQPATSAFSSAGTLLEVKITGTYSEVWEVYGIDQAGGESDRIEVTTMGSPGQKKEYITGYSDTGEFNYESNHLPANAVAQYLEALKNSRAENDFRITSNDPGNEQVEFAARVEVFNRQWRVGEAVKVTLRLKQTGLEVVTP